jgi:5-methyltetrahydrofolate--homocysteine methyltransferase
LTFKEAQANALKLKDDNYTATTPRFTGARVVEGIKLEDIAPYIDWQPFFIAWEMHGKFPALLKDEVIGKEATKLYEDAQQLLQQIITEKWLKPQGVIGFWSVEKTAPDTVELHHENKKIHLEFLRQQIKKAEGQPNMSLADFIPSEGKDFMGAFSVTIQGVDEQVKRFEEKLDDYNKIMLQALADRLAEAFAEYLHERVRKVEWGYASDESLDNEALIGEQYVGIRPAPGYPACPDHTEKNKLFELLGGEAKTGIKLTESLAMYPASSVCGWYFAHPDSKYFGLGKIERDQLEEYAHRKNMTLLEAEKWLRPILE